jgi:hypothetical protein
VVYKILYLVELLLYNDRMMGGYTRAVYGQRLRKHVLVARQQMLNNETDGLQQWKGCVFYVVRAEMLYARDKVTYSPFCTGVCEGRTGTACRGIAIVGAVTRKRLIID